MAPFIVSSFGLFVRDLFHGLFTAPSWQTFTCLACGWALAVEHHTVTTYLWLTGATTFKHFSRFYVFLGAVLYPARWLLWARIIRCAAQCIPVEVPIVLVIDDSTKKKAGTHILPERRIRVLGDGGYATKEYLHQLPASVDVVSRLLIRGKLYALPPKPAGRRGCPPKKGPLLGSPETLARTRHGWQLHPREAGALGQT